MSGAEYCRVQGIAALLTPRAEAENESLLAWLREQTTGPVIPAGSMGLPNFSFAFALLLTVCGMSLE